MLAVTICTTCSAAILAGLIAGIAAGFVAARVAIVDALLFDGVAGLTSRAAARLMPA